MKTKKKNIAFYISSHGFGHFARAIIIIKKLIKDFNIFIKSDIALKKFEYELSTENRKYKVIPAAFDVGCIQKSFVDIDIEKTLQTAEIVQLQNEKNYSSEKKFLIDNNIDFILADAASYPLKLGAELNIPRFLISNFTWYDIYSNFPKVFTKKYSTLISAIKYEYSCATAQMCPGLAIENDYIKQKYNFGLITSPSKNIKSELYEKYNIKNKITAFIYFGNFDNKIINWHNLKNNTNAVFLTKDDIPIKSENLIKINDEYNFADLILSTDIVITKPGYSTVANAVYYKKPILFCSRKHFYEYYSLRDFILSNNAGLLVDSANFFDCNWSKYIDKSLKLKIRDVSGAGADEIKTVILYSNSTFTKSNVSC